MNHYNIKYVQAKKCVRDAIASGILSDGYSGSQVDLVVITKDKTDYLRAYDVVCDKGDRIGKYGFKPGTTPVVHQKVNFSRVPSRVGFPARGNLETIIFGRNSNRLSFANK